MMSRFFLGSILTLFGGSGLAHAQYALGTPMTAENKIDWNHGQYAPAVYSTTRQVDAPARPSHPFLNLVARTLLMPIRAASGHLMPPHYEEALPTRIDVAHMIADGGYSPAEITAAKIKIDEAKGSARRAAVKYLATIDCQYYPEAETGLIAALRADRSENVRYEAALALANSRGLTGKILEALNMTALGLELDGNPAETSERVRAAARVSLYRCSVRGLCLPPHAHEVALALDWLAPETTILQPSAHPLPAPAPVILTKNQQDRDLAESVSTTSRQGITLMGSRSLSHYLFNVTSERVRDSQSPIDSRLRGLRPLGSEATLAIPKAHIEAAPLPPMPLYNYPQ